MARNRRTEQQIEGIFCICPYPTQLICHFLLCSKRESHCSDSGVQNNDRHLFSLDSKCVRHHKNVMFLPLVVCARAYNPATFITVIVIVPRLHFIPMAYNTNLCNVFRPVGFIIIYPLAEMRYVFQYMYVCIRIYLFNNVQCMYIIVHAVRFSTSASMPSASERNGPMHNSVHYVGHFSYWFIGVLLCTKPKSRENECESR